MSRLMTLHQTTKGQKVSRWVKLGMGMMKAGGHHSRAVIRQDMQIQHRILNQD
jgi:hypothetical protein